MTLIDWIIFIGYIISIVSIGVILGKLVKNSSDLFTAGGQSPWWVSGLSGFMAMFSANTFVVWGGIAFKYGVVAIAINICYGLSALAVGFTIAGKWKKLGIKTPTEYIQKRFGNKTLQFYTWFMMLFRIFSSAGALYAFSTIIITILFGDANGNVDISGLDRNSTILLVAVVVIAYTMIGGLWAVLMTDTIQFIILNLAVIFVVPLAIMNLPDGAIANAPTEFFMPLSVEYSFYFLVGWFAIHYFVIGAELAYVQRYICVPSPKDARKSAYLFGGLYIVSPIIWLLPSLLWRLQVGIPEGIDEMGLRDLAERAYILACKAVLPSGMLGLMVAALFAATASMLSSQLNVFSGVLTHDIYKPLVKNPSDKSLVMVGRGFTVLIGIVIAGIAIIIPYLGGVEKVIIKITQLMAVPILAPVLVSLLNKKIGARAFVYTVGICFPLGMLSIGLNTYDWFGGSPLAETLKTAWYANNTTIGVMLPIAITLLICAVSPVKEDAGWKAIQSLEANEAAAQKMKESPVPLTILAWSMLVFTLMMLVLTIITNEQRAILGIFTLVLGLISAIAFGVLKLKTRKKETA